MHKNAELQHVFCHKHVKTVVFILLVVLYTALLAVLHPVLVCLVGCAGCQMSNVKIISCRHQWDYQWDNEKKKKQFWKQPWISCWHQWGYRWVFCSYLLCNWPSYRSALVLAKCNAVHCIMQICMCVHHCTCALHSVHSTVCTLCGVDTSACMQVASVTNTAYAQWTQLTPPFLSDTDHSATVSGSITLAFEHLCPHHMSVLWSSVSLLLVWQTNSGSLLTNVKGFPKSSDPLFCIVQDPLHQAKCNVLNFVQLDCTRLTRSHEVQCLELHTAPYSLLCWKQSTKDCYAVNQVLSAIAYFLVSPYFL